MSDLSVAATCVAPVTVLIAYVEVLFQAKPAELWAKAYFNLSFFVFVVLLLVGNLTATAMSGGAAGRIDVERAWLVQALFGLGGFQLVLKNTNLKVFGKGLAFEDWLSKAKQMAVEGCLRTQTRLEQREAHRMAGILQALDLGKLNAYVSGSLGKDYCDALGKKAQSTNADEKLLKARAFAMKCPDEARAITDK